MHKYQLSYSTLLGLMLKGLCVQGEGRYGFPCKKEKNWAKAKMKCSLNYTVVILSGLPVRLLPGMLFDRQLLYHITC